MQTKRKIQLSAAAVIANGLLALTAMSPGPALAAGCADHDYVPGCGCPVTCATFSGCTLTQKCLLQPPVCASHPFTFCTYN
jgi:hypothetical protein